MRKAANPLLRPYRGKPAILDANILLFYWCASFDPTLVNSFKRLNSFRAEDIGLLHRTMEVFSAIRTTPHVLTEVSNLANSLPQWRKVDWSRHFAQRVELIPEKWISAQTIIKDPALVLGLTDAGLCALASDHVILTIDFPLSNYLESKRLNVINFTHLRAAELE